MGEALTARAPCTDLLRLRHDTEQEQLLAGTVILRLAPRPLAVGSLRIPPRGGGRRGTTGSAPWGSIEHAEGPGGQLPCG